MAVVFIAVVSGIFYIYLRMYTDHGDALEVPDIRGNASEIATAQLEDMGLRAVVIDSVYSENSKGGFVFEQSPLPGSKVKEDRLIYLTVYRKTPPAEIVGVKEGMNERVAQIILQNKGIKFDVQYEENHLLDRMVIRVLHRGTKLKPTSQVKKGDRVTLVVGQSSDGRVSIPSLRGLTLEEAENILNGSRLTLGSTLFDFDVVTAQDSATARVYAQTPSPTSEPSNQVGSLVDIYLGFRAEPVDSLFNGD